METWVLEVLVKDITFVLTRYEFVHASTQMDNLVETLNCKKL